MAGRPTAQAKTSGRPWWRSPVPWGIVMSFAVATVPFLLSPHDTTLILAILVALTGVMLTLLTDPLLRINDLEERAILTLRDLNDSMGILDVPPSLLRFTKDMVQDWQSLETDGGEYRQTLLRAYVEEAKSRIHSIAQGRHEHGISDPNNFRAASLEMFRSLRTLNAKNFLYWTQPHGREYLDRQREAIAAGRLDVERILVLGADDLKVDDVKSTIKYQDSIGIKLRLIMREEVPGSLAEYVENDFALVTDIRQDRMLVKPINAERESISFSPDDIAEYQNAYDELRRYSRGAAQVVQVNTEAANYSAKELEKPLT
jgi:hypothetical protein